MQYYLAGSAASNQYQQGGLIQGIEVPPGEHIYPFSFQLPPVLPSTYEGKWGSVRYIVTATCVVPWATDVVMEARVFVMSHFDLNSMPQCANPFILTKSKTFCCLFCKSDPLTVEVTIPVTGYVPGQSIPISIDCENKSNVDVSAVLFRLVCNVVFTVQTPTVKTKHTKNVIRAINAGPLKGGKTMECKQLLFIPNDTVAHLRHCGIISLNYNLEMEFVAPGCRRNLYGEIPITLGTIGLASFQSPVNEAGMNDISLSMTMGGQNQMAINARPPPSPKGSIGWMVNGADQNIVGEYSKICI